MSRNSNPRAGRPDRLWWLAPGTIFCLVIGLTILAAAWQSDAAFRLYGAPKFIGLKHVVLAAAAIVAFAIGDRLAAVTGKDSKMTPAIVDRGLQPWFWVSFGLALFGYAAWLGVGLKNGFSLDTLHELLTSDEPLLAETMRDEMFYTVQGVTTCTQFGIAAVLLGLWLCYRGQRVFAWPVVMLFALAGIRALIFSERLAVIELLVPASVLTLRMQFLGKWHSPARRWLLEFAPLAGVAALVVFFGSFEYFRSWRFYRHEFDSYSQFTLWRVGGYYTTAHNNGAMALETQAVYPLPYATIQSLWRFPGLAKTSLGYQSLTGLDPMERHRAMLEQFGTPELNNEGGLFQPALDFGLAGIVVFWFGCGLVAGRLYRGYLAGNIAGVTLYPLVFLAILETPRFLYLCYPRSLPTVLMLLLVAVVAARGRQPAPFPAAIPIPA